MSRISLQPDKISAALRAPLVVVIPIHNESTSIRGIIAAWQSMFERLDIQHQFVLINDGSTDSTLKVLEQMEESDPSHLVIVDKPNSGHGRTCRLGYSAACASSLVEWILQIDSDGQCDPAYFPEFWSRREKCDCIFGQRVRRDDGFARAMTSWICKIGSTLLGGMDMVDPNVPYRLIRRKVLSQAIRDIPASFDIHNVAVTFVLKHNPDLRWTYIPIRFLERSGGKNSINLLDVAHLGTSMLFDLAKLRRTMHKTAR